MNLKFNKKNFEHLIPLIRPVWDRIVQYDVNWLGAEKPWREWLCCRYIAVSKIKWHTYIWYIYVKLDIIFYVRLDNCIQISDNNSNNIIGIWSEGLFGDWWGPLPRRDYLILNSFIFWSDNCSMKFNINLPIIYNDTHIGVGI